MTNQPTYTDRDATNMIVRRSRRSERFLHDLIISVWSHPLAGGGNVHVRVYADGRFLRNRQTDWSWTGGLSGQGRYLDVTGWQERRLTAEGVGLLRSEISSSGLFDPDQPVPDGGEASNSVSGTTLGIIEVLNGDAAVEVHCCWGANSGWATEFDPLLNRLREPESWLPPSAWEDLERTPYVPSWYAVCLSIFRMAPPIEPSPLVSVLPAPAQVALDGARYWSEPQDNGGPASHCFDLDADNTRRFTGALDDAGIEPVEGDDLYAFEASPVVGTVTIFVSPYLPHGEADCGCSG